MHKIVPLFQITSFLIWITASMLSDCGFINDSFMEIVNQLHSISVNVRESDYTSTHTEVARTIRK